MPAKNKQNMESGGVYIGLGANLARDGSTPAETLAAAIDELHKLAGPVVARSSFWASPAWPDPSDPAYTNSVVELATGLDAEPLLDTLQGIENVFGRVREQRWASRTVDLDIIDFRGQIRCDERLQLPHPRAHGRAFVLLPLQEIAPHWIDPVSGRGIADLVTALDVADVSATRKLEVAL